MELNRFFECLLQRYAKTFDIYKPYFMDGREYPAYLYLHQERTNAGEEKRLWASDSYEHIMLICAEKITMEQIKEAEELISGHMEPELVRKGSRAPQRNHMYSFLTVILLSQYQPSRNVQRQVRKYSFEKGYRLNLRGFCSGRLVLVSLEDRRVVTSRAAEKKAGLINQVFEEADAWKAPALEDMATDSN